jgi:hypothetical protein
MLKEGELVGAIAIYRQEVRPFTARQIELVNNFAAQAVIAIENTRLLNELRQRTDDLAEALEQQTATAEVLSVISSSPGKLEPVFQAMLTNAVRICDAKFGQMYLRDGDAFRAVATHNAPPAYVEARSRDLLLRPPPDVPLGRVVIAKEAVQIADYFAFAGTQRLPEQFALRCDDRGEAASRHAGDDVDFIEQAHLVPLGPDGAPQELQHAVRCRSRRTFPARPAVQAGLRGHEHRCRVELVRRTPAAGAQPALNDKSNRVRTIAHASRTLARA